MRVGKNLLPAPGSSNSGPAYPFYKVLPKMGLQLRGSLTKTMDAVQYGSLPRHLRVPQPQGVAKVAKDYSLLFDAFDNGLRATSPFPEVSPSGHAIRKAPPTLRNILDV